MHKLSETIDRKFVDVIDVDEWEIESDNGWVDINDVKKTIPYQKWIVRTENGLELIGADTHIIFDANNEEIFIKDCIPFETKVQTKYGLSYVISVDKTEEYDNMYDIEVDSKEHTYYTNDILSHNSITTVGYLLHYILFNKHKNVGILANRAKTARGILSKLKQSYRQLPKFLQSGVVEWNKGSIELENGCIVFADATSESASRSEAISLLILDEFAFVDNNKAEEFMKSVYPTISSGTTSKIFIFSTPNGMNHFYKLWTESVEGRNGYVPYEILWSDVPGRDEKFKKDTIANIGEAAWRQEFEINFLGSAGSLLSATVMARMVHQTPILSEEYTNIYFKPERDHNYVITVDPSEGLGLDYSVAVVTDVTEIPYQQCAIYRNNTIDPHIFPDVIYNLAMRYNNAFVLVEANNIGSVVCNILHYTLEYENLIHTTSKGRSGQIVSGGFGGDDLIGVKTTPATKRIGCAITKSLIESDQYIVNDFETIKEFTTFVRHLNTYQAEEGYYDDICMCIILFSWLINNDYFKDMMDNNDIRKKIMDGSHLKHLEEALVPFGHLDNGMEQDHIIEENTPDHLKNGSSWGWGAIE